MASVVDTYVASKEIKEENRAADFECGDNNPVDLSKPSFDRAKDRGEKTYDCDREKCDYNTMNKAAFVAHSVKHSTASELQEANSNHSTTYNNNVAEHPPTSPAALEGTPKRDDKRYSPYDPFKCNFCSYSTLYKSCLETHMLRHESSKKDNAVVNGDGAPGEKRFRCTHCAYGTMYKKCLHTHMSQHVNSTTPPHPMMPMLIPNSQYYPPSYSPPATPYYPPSYSPPTSMVPPPLFDVKKAAQMEHPLGAVGGILTCPLCNFTTIDKHAIAVHVAQSHPAHFSDFTMDQFISEYSSTMGSTFRCNLCGFASVHKSTLIKHVITHKEQFGKGLEGREEHIPCTQCAFSSPNPLIMQTHLQQHAREMIINTSTHNERLFPGQHHQIGDFKCGACDFRALDETALKYHQEKLCVKSFQEQQSTPISAKQLGPSDKPFKCTTCRYSTVYENCLKTHMAKHSTDFKDILKSGLTPDMENTKNGKMYKCNLCTYTTMYKSCLATHLLRHKCGIFSKNFKSTSDKDGEDMILNCDKCSFNTTSDLTMAIHDAQHSGSVEIKCPVCLLYSSSEEALINHYNTTHKESTDGFMDSPKSNSDNDQSEDNFCSSPDPKPDSPSNAPEKEISCPVRDCASQFKTKGKLEQHLIDNHNTAMINMGDVRVSEGSKQSPYPDGVLPRPPLYFPYPPGGVDQRPMNPALMPDYLKTPFPFMNGLDQSNMWRSAPVGPCARDEFGHGDKRVRSDSIDSDSEGKSEEEHSVKRFAPANQDMRFAPDEGKLMGKRPPGLVGSKDSFHNYMLQLIKTMPPSDILPSYLSPQVPGENNARWFFCKHCGIAFNDCMLYTMHTGYHGFRNPFQCNFCGFESNNKYDFSLHLFRSQHA